LFVVIGAYGGFFFIGSFLPAPEALREMRVVRQPLAVCLSFI
jgi:hypothetical protein